jgi:hypothetical protein
VVILVVVALPLVPALACVIPTKPPGLASATVERVSDGDTVILSFPDGRRERACLIGLDAPEAYGSEKLEPDMVRTRFRA